MTGKRLFAFLLIVFGLFAGVIVSQEPAPRPQAAPSPSASDNIRLNVVVTPKSGVPVSDLAPPDFTVLDNKSPRPITSFKIVTPADEPVEVILFLDEVNADQSAAIMQRDGIVRYLRSNGGKLPFPTSVALFTDHGAQIQPTYSTDGNSIADALAHTPLDQREITRGTSFGDFDRVHMSLNALHQFIPIAARLPGRKIVLWISPGWPLMTTLNYRRQTDSRQQQQLFDEIVYFSTQLRRANVTLYNIDAAAVQEMRETNYYQAFVNGVSRPGDALIGNVSLQALALQSGGLVLQSSTDVGTMIRRALLDLGAWYEIAFQPLPADQPDAYHHLEIKVDKPGLKVRTRDGYYANPTANPEK